MSPTREDYMRWFPQMKAMNVDVLRVYTILEHEFYEALDDFNAGREDPLWLDLLRVLGQVVLDVVR